MPPTKVKILLLAASLMFPALGLGQPHGPVGLQQWLTLAEQELISREQAIAIAKGRHKGKVLSADLVNKSKDPAYKVKLLTDKGRVKTVRIKARSKKRNKN